MTALVSNWSFASLREITPWVHPRPSLLRQRNLLPPAFARLQLVNWFKRLCLPQKFQSATLQTLRQQILLMPAQLVRTGNRSRLNLPASGRRELAWLHALRTIERLRL
jgi:hypothetical protein